MAGTDTTRYTYDALGNLVTVVLPSGQRIDYLIDGRNRRVARRIDGVMERRWLYQDGLEPIAELDGAGKLLWRFVYGTRGHVPDLAVRGDTVYRVVTDQLGSVRALVRASDGVVRAWWNPDAWGRMVTGSGPGPCLGFAGGLTDSLTGLVRFGARDYDPGTGRWTAKDLIGFVGEDANLYAYVGNRPLDRVDPSGTIDSDDLGMRALNPPATLGVLSPVETLKKKRSEVQAKAYSLLTEAKQDPSHVNRWEHAEFARWLGCEYGKFPALLLMSAKEVQDFFKDRQTWEEWLYDVQSNQEGLFGEIPNLPLRPTPFDRGNSGGSRP